MWFYGSMKAIFVRELTEQEREALKQGLRSGSAFTVRRSQILLSSDRGHKAPQIAEQLQCSAQCVREAIHAFQREGLGCLEEKSRRPHSASFSFSEEALSRLPDLISASPRAYGFEHSLWSLERLAQACYQEGLIREVVSYETMRDAVQRIGVNWKRARKRLQSTDEAYEVKKNIEMS